MKNTKKIAVLAAALLSTASAGMAIQMRPSTEARAHAGSNNPDAMAQRLQAEVLLGQQATDELSKVLQLILKNGVENVIAALNNDQYLVPVVGGDYYSFIVPNANGRQFVYMIDPKNRTAAVRVSDLQTGLWNQAMSDFISPSMKGEREFGTPSTSTAPKPVAQAPIQNGVIKAGDIDRNLREKEEALRRAREEAERARKEAEQAKLEKQRREAEARREAERLRLEKQRQEEEARRRAEAERRRREEARRKAEEERQRRSAAILAEQKRAEAEVEAAQRKAEAEAAKRLEEAEAAARKRAEAEIAIARQLAETERAVAKQKAAERRAAVKKESDRELAELRGQSVESLAGMNSGSEPEQSKPQKSALEMNKEELNEAYQRLLRRKKIK